MSSAGVGPLCFVKTKVTAPVYQDIFEHFVLPFAYQLFKDADFIFQQDLAPAHTAKSTKLNMVLVCLTGQQTHQTWLSRGKWEIRDTNKNADELKATVKEIRSGLPYHLSSATN